MFSVMTKLSTYHLILVTTILVGQEVSSQSSCDDDRTKALENVGESNLLGAFVPECDSDGYYKTKQCHASTGQCWCVERDTGHGIESTRVNPGKPTIDCDAAQSSSCNAERAKALKEAGESNLIGAFAPECDSDGNYKTKQCYASTGQCWCVKRDTGNEIEETRVGPRQSTINCNAAQPGFCNTERAKSLEEAGESNLVGAFIPKCDSDGNYKTKQCHGSTGQCWCVETDTGNEIEDTRVKSRQPTVDCDTAQPGFCNNKRTQALEEAGESNVVGVFVPECDSDGYYQTKQCYTSTGQCWCVKRDTGNEIEGTRVNPGQRTADCDAAQSNQKNSRDENDACYEINKKMIMKWNEKMRKYNEIHMERWKKNMDAYEELIGSS